MFLKSWSDISMDGKLESAPTCHYKAFFSTDNIRVFDNPLLKIVNIVVSKIDKENTELFKKTCKIIYKKGSNFFHQERLAC